MRILLAGGGSGGPAVPLLAVQQKIQAQHPDAEFLFIGTVHGPERKFAEQYNVPFVSVPAGKLRRYLSWRNFAAPFQVFVGFVKSWSIIRTFKPDVIFSAGGYVSVPVVMAAWMLRKKILIHQQDVYPSLTNQIIAPLAVKITVSFESSTKDFRISSGLIPTGAIENKIIWTGNPYREELLKVHKDVAAIKYSFGIDDQLPVILFMGGATGAMPLNRILLEALPRLTEFAHVIHSTGKGKGINFIHPNYHPYELIENMAEAYAISDIVISRAGLSSITELAALKKVSIIIPMPGTHQEFNADALAKKEAAICLDQDQLNGEMLISLIRKIMYDAGWQAELKNNIHQIMPANATDKIAEILINLCHK